MTLISLLLLFCAFRRDPPKVCVEDAFHKRDKAIPVLLGWNAGYGLVVGIPNRLKAILELLYSSKEGQSINDSQIIDAFSVC